MSFFAELRRRNVFKVGAAYAIVAWLLLQITDVVLPTFDTPQWVAQTIMFVLAIGFPIAVVVAWAFDLTPQGIEASSLSTTQAQPRPTALRFGYISQALILLAVGFLVVDQYVLERGGTSASAESENNMSPPRHLSRFSFELPDDQAFGVLGRSALAISPDGRQFVYAGSDGLYLRSMSRLEPELLIAPEDNFQDLIFSPNGEAVAYVEGVTGELKRVSTAGGPPVVIADNIDARFGASWVATDTILVAGLEGITEVSVIGDRSPELIIPAGPGERVSYPSLLPGGDSILFSVTSSESWDFGEIVVESISTHERRQLTAGTNPRYLPTGHLVFALGSSLFGIRFDIDSLTVAGAVVSLDDGVYRATQVWESGIAQYDVSANGTLVYIPPNSAGRSVLAWVERDGEASPISIEPGSYRHPRISPDGRQVALDDRNAGNDIWIWDLANETRDRLTLGVGGGDSAVWTPDGARIAYHPAVGERIDWQASNNVGGPERLATGELIESGSWHPDTFLPTGELLLSGSRPGAGRSIGMFSPDSNVGVVWLLDSPYDERNADVSADGRWIAYQSDESGEYQVYVRPFPDVDLNRWRVSVDGGIYPKWSADGSELFYIEPGSPDHLISVSVEDNEAVFSAGERMQLFEWLYYSTGGNGMRTYDVSPDGQRFLVITEGEIETRTRQIVIVENWFEDIDRLIPLSE